MKLLYRPAAPARDRLGCLALFFSEDKLRIPAGLPAGWRETIQRALALKEFEGKSGQSLTLITGAGSAERLMLIGLGASEKLTRELLRRAAGSAGKVLAGMKVRQAGVWMPAGLPRTVASEAGEAIAEGLVEGTYTFRLYKSEPETARERTRLDTIFLYDPAKAASRESVARGSVRGGAVCFARTLGNHPGNVLTPSRLAEEAHSLAKRRKLRCTVLERRDMEKLGMGLLLGVAQGSRQPPKLIILEYRARGAKSTLAFVGKGITFDSGGISIKSAASMDEMKFDMCGAAAVLGAMDAIAQLAPAVNVVGIAPATENLPDGQATKPGDIHKAFSGKHVEILNTDAEGRLVLADALAYGIQKYKPAAVVDLATLTGACVVALGHYASGAITNHEAFQQQVVAAGKRSGDVVWPLPNFPEYEEGLKGKYADLQNTGGRDGGAITGGLFLKQFVGEVPWVHLDIAGTAWGVKNVGHIPNEGATGVGVALLVDLAMSWKGLRE